MSRFRPTRQKTEYNFWPSFVDALSTLLIVVLFFLLLFVLGHFFLGRNLDTKNNEISRLNAELGSGYEWWKNFYEFHKLAIDELEAFDYETYKKNGFKVVHLGDYPLELEEKPD